MRLSRFPLEFPDSVVSASFVSLSVDVSFSSTLNRHQNKVDNFVQIRELSK